MIAVPVRYDMDRFFDQLQGTDAIDSLAVQMDVIEVIVRERFARTAPIPPKRFYDIDSLCKFVEPDRVL